MIFDKPISLAVSAVTSLMFEFTKIPHIERFNQPTFTYRTQEPHPDRWTKAIQIHMVGHWSYPIFASQETTKPEYSILQALSTKNQMIHTKTGGLITQNQTTWHIKSPTAPLQFRDDCFGISSRRAADRYGFWEVAYRDIHHGQLVVRNVQQCTRLPILG